ncbi:MAG TPA: hypothetical protein ENN99_00045 [Chloroflexi bacterium]|nr:hypothetical protein [Chloroflexota bacterium]
MPTIPPLVIKKLYVPGSLCCEESGFSLLIKNTIAPATITAFTGLDVDQQPVDPTRVTLILSEHEQRALSEVTAATPIPFPINALIRLRVSEHSLAPGPHDLALHFTLQEIGPLDLPISDTLT